MDTDIRDGNVYRVGKSGNTNVNHNDSIQKRPSRSLFASSIISDPPDEYKEFRGWVAYSVFWKEHRCCTSPREIIRLFNICNKPKILYQTIWQITSSKAEEPFEINSGESNFVSAFKVIHWPEISKCQPKSIDLLKAHCHLLLPPYFSGNSRSKKNLRKAAIETLLNYLVHIRTFLLEELGDLEKKGMVN